MAQREIKFRAWDHGKLRSWEEINFFHMSVFDKDDDTVWDQYTEMYDEEDNSIYDSDVIKVWDNGIGVVFNENGVFKVDFKDGRKYPLEFWWQDFTSGKAPDNPYKVLGNIHENAELLEAE